jgi:hypothetical protein
MGKNAKPLGEIMSEVPLDGTLKEMEPKFCQEDWLNISEVFSPRHFFWIHLANCSVDLGGSTLVPLNKDEHDFSESFCQLMTERCSDRDYRRSAFSMLVHSRSSEAVEV